MSELLRFKGKIIGATISHRAGYWFISIQVEITDSAINRDDNEVVGVDLGVETLVTLSNGEKYRGAKATIKYAKIIKVKPKVIKMCRE